MLADIMPPAHVAPAVSLSKAEFQKEYAAIQRDETADECKADHRYSGLFQQAIAAGWTQREIAKTAKIHNSRVDQILRFKRFFVYLPTPVGKKLLKTLAEGEFRAWWSESRCVRRPGNAEENEQKRFAWIAKQLESDAQRPSTVAVAKRRETEKYTQIKQQLKVLQKLVNLPSIQMSLLDLRKQVRQIIDLFEDLKK